jgi:hypothetical protein
MHLNVNLQLLISVVAVGDTIIVSLVAPLLHVKLPHPVAIRVADAPNGIVWSGPALTIIVFST